MNTHEEFEDFLRLLNENKVEYVIAKDIVVASAAEYEFYRQQAGSVFRIISEKGVVLYAR